MFGTLVMLVVIKTKVRIKLKVGGDGRSWQLRAKVAGDVRIRGVA